MPEWTSTPDAQAFGESGGMPPMVRNTRRAASVNRASFPYGAPPCRISRPARSVTQAGSAGRHGRWVLEFAPAGRRWIEPLMGWTATDDAFAAVRLSFPSLASAVDYAEREGLDYIVFEPPARRPVRRTEHRAEAGFWPDLDAWQVTTNQQNSTDLEVQT
jgi:hypothetical protein